MQHIYKHIINVIVDLQEKKTTKKAFFFVKHGKYGRERRVFINTIWKQLPMKRCETH